MPLRLDVESSVYSLRVPTKTKLFIVQTAVLSCKDMNMIINNLAEWKMRILIPKFREDKANIKLIDNYKASFSLLNAKTRVAFFNFIFTITKRHILLGDGISS